MHKSPAALLWKWYTNNLMPIPYHTIINYTIICSVYLASVCLHSQQKYYLQYSAILTSLFYQLSSLSVPLSFYLRIIIYPFDIRNLSRFADHCLSSQSIVFSYRTLDLFQNKQALLDITLSYFHISCLKLLPVKHVL